MPGRKMNPYRGWEIYPKGIYDIMINLKQNYSNIKSFISENGMGVENEQRFLKDGRIEDDYRIRFYRIIYIGYIERLMKALIVMVIICGHLWIIGHG